MFPKILISLIFTSVSFFMFMLNGADIYLIGKNGQLYEKTTYPLGIWKSSTYNLGMIPTNPSLFCKMKKTKTKSRSSSRSKTRSSSTTRTKITYEIYMKSDGQTIELNSMKPYSKQQDCTSAIQDIQKILKTKSFNYKYPDPGKGIGMFITLLFMILGISILFSMYKTISKKSSQTNENNTI